MATAPRILVASPDIHIQRYYSAILSAGNKQCIPELAKTTAELITHLANHRPEVLLLDLDLLHDSNGDIINAVNALSVPSVVLLADGDPHVSQLPDIRHIAVLRKPTSAARIKELLDHVVNSNKPIPFGEEMLYPMTS